ncbi:MAG: hypothetical protein NC123_20660, partial [Butyrivibrio sp.]|nr:hypothetical protein [Butyrivibrio sp.]
IYEGVTLFLCDNSGWYACAGRSIHTIHSTVAVPGKQAMTINVGLPRAEDDTARTRLPVRKAFMGRAAG